MTWHLCRIDRPTWIAWLKLEAKLCDFWIGAFWHTKKADYSTRLGDCSSELHIYVCLLPCLPLHLIIPSHTKPTTV